MSEYENETTAERLRRFAVDIERGLYGDVSEGALVFRGIAGLHVVGLGTSSHDGPLTHYLLACGQRMVEQPMLDKSKL